MSAVLSFQHALFEKNNPIQLVWTCTTAQTFPLLHIIVLLFSIFFILQDVLICAQVRRVLLACVDITCLQIEPVAFSQHLLLTGGEGLTVQVWHFEMTGRVVRFESADSSASWESSSTEWVQSLTHSSSDHSQI